MATEQFSDGWVKDKFCGMCMVGPECKGILKNEEEPITLIFF